MDFALAPLLLREWEMNDAGSLARVSLTLHRLSRAQRRNLAAARLITAIAPLGRHRTNGLGDGAVGASITSIQWNLHNHWALTRKLASL